MDRVQAPPDGAYASSELSLLVAICRTLEHADHVDSALERSLDLICRHTGWQVGHAYLTTASGDLTPGHVWWLEDDAYALFRDQTMGTELHSGEGLPGRVLAARRPLWLGSLASASNFPRAAAAAAVGLQSGIALPVTIDDDVVAVLEFFTTGVTEPHPPLVEVLDTSAMQLGRTWARQRADAALALSQARFRAVAETAHDAIVSSDSLGVITFANEAAALMFGRESSELIGRPLTVLMPEHFRAAHLAGMQRFLATREKRVIGTVVEVTAVRADGTEFPVELSLGHGTTREGDFFAGIVRDISDRRRDEARAQSTVELEQAAAEQLRVLDEMKNSFLTAVSHEMRTPLASVLGIALTLDRNPDLDDESRYELVGQLARNANRLDHLLKDLLDVDRLTRGVVELQTSEQDMGAVARRVVEASGLTGHSVAVEVREGPVVARVDIAKVERILEHLLGNVGRHTQPATPVWVHVQRLDDGVLIGVDDAGPGVPAELWERIFEPFAQGPTMRPYSPGTGLGLSLVARLAALHGGRAWVEDRVGGGAAFRVLLRDGG
jgi:PAS domain S-box-containing protein